MKHKLLACLAMGIFFFNSCKEDTAVPVELNETSDYSADVAIKWINLQRNLVKSTSGFTPPVAARAYGYAGLALYESVVAGIRTNKSYKGLIQEFDGKGLPEIEIGKNYDWELSANAAMASILRNLFKTTSSANLSAIDQLEQEVKDQSATTDPEVIQRSIDFGKGVAEAIYTYSKLDNQDEAYLNNFPAYTVPTGPGKWEPTAANQKPLQPYWGNVRTFLSSDAQNSLFVENTPFSSDPKSVFYLQANEVYITSINLTEEQKRIAKFWSDDPGLTATPPGHSMSIAGIVLKQENADLALAAEVYSKVGLAVHDAFVSCWKCKYVYNLLRPVTFIQRYIDPQFTTLLSTPPFPEHTSGHSVQTAASMAVLEDYFGYHYALTDDTHKDRTDIDGSPRNFNSFAQLANEAAISRLYGGIHFRPAIELGISQGHEIGRNIAGINLKK